MSTPAVKACIDLRRQHREEVVRVVMEWLNANASDVTLGKARGFADSISDHVCVAVWEGFNLGVNAELINKKAES